MSLLALLVLPGFLLPFVGFFLPPPRNRPAGVLYWLALGAFLLALILAGVGFTVGAFSDHARYGAFAWWHWAGPLVCVAVTCALLANTFWALGQARRLPPGMGEEDRREHLRRLSRRLWMPLCALSLLALVLPFGLMRFWASAPAVPPVPVNPGTGGAAHERCRVEAVRRLPDGALHIEVSCRPLSLGMRSLDTGRLAFSAPRLVERNGRRTGRREWPCEFLSPAVLKGRIPAEVPVVLRVHPDADALSPFLLMDFEFDGRTGFGSAHGSGSVSADILLPAGP